METRIERLRVESGLKMTGQRRAIAWKFTARADQPDVQELCRWGPATNSRIVVAAMHRAAQVSEEAGFAKRKNFNGGRARREPVKQGRDHCRVNTENEKAAWLENTAYEAAAAAAAAGNLLGVKRASCEHEAEPRLRGWRQAATLAHVS